MTLRKHPNVAPGFRIEFGPFRNFEDPVGQRFYKI